jgi:hypothetical protein
MSYRQERRILERTWIYRDALLSIAGLRSACSCGIRDMNAKGVGLRLNGLPLLPSEFKISLDGFRTTLVCRLIWRDGDFAGAAFASTTE